MACEKKHLFFEPMENGSFQAIDTWCGRIINNKVWYCSEECKLLGEEGIPPIYKMSLDEPIMND